MRVINSPQKIQQYCLNLRRRGKTIAVVPTMGALHDGHVTLLHRARKKADVVILTIFVNPTQFGPKEDFKKYPRDHWGDLAKAKSAGTDIVFMPEVHEIYPPGYQTYVEVTKATQELCGASRPTHFKGVTTIVLKLLNLTQPHFAFFGLKDYQQYCVIKKMVEDLNLPIEVIGVPTVREADGLAMSSRNQYLDPQQRKNALCLYRGLQKVKEEIKGGNTSIQNLLQLLKKEIEPEVTQIDYITCMEADTIEPLKIYKPKNTLFALAVFVGKTRLIDNMVV